MFLIAGVGCIVLGAQYVGICLTRNGKLWITTRVTLARQNGQDAHLRSSAAEQWDSPI
jgi:hypothetical protein